MSTMSMASSMGLSVVQRLPGPASDASLSSQHRPSAARRPGRPCGLIGRSLRLWPRRASGPVARALGPATGRLGGRTRRGGRLRRRTRRVPIGTVSILDCTEQREKRLARAADPCLADFRGRVALVNPEPGVVEPGVLLRRGSRPRRPFRGCRCAHEPLDPFRRLHRDGVVGSLLGRSGSDW